LVPKCQSPWAGRIDGAYAFAVNGEACRVLNLNRGSRYYFNIKQPLPDGGYNYLNHFYFTADPLGGPSNGFYDPIKLECTPDPVAQGTICLDITDDLPSHFFYQSRDTQAMGGIIIVHGERKRKQCLQGHSGCTISSHYQKGKEVQQRRIHATKATKQ